MPKKIPLTKGQFAIVDDEDFALVNQYKWYATTNGYGWYAQTDIWKYGRKNRIGLRMHRLIMGLKKGDKRKIDHRNRNGLNNQKNNLRFCTSSQNAANLVSNTGSSKYKGVCYHVGKWQAEIEYHEKGIYLGRFENEIDAAKAYDKAAKKYFGEFARPNFRKAG